MYVKPLCCTPYFFRIEVLGFSFFLNFSFYIGVQLINNVFVSGVQQSDSVIHIHVSVPFQILFTFRLLHNIEQSSLYYTVVDSFFFFFNFIYLFMAVLGLHFCARAFSSCGKWGPLFITVRGPLAIVASLVAEHRLQTRRLSNCGSRVQSLQGMWDLPRPGLEPVSPALASRFSTTAPPGKPKQWTSYKILQQNVTKLLVHRRGRMNLSNALQSPICSSVIQCR